VPESYCVSNAVSGKMSGSPLYISKLGSASPENSVVVELPSAATGGSCPPTGLGGRMLIAKGIYTPATRRIDGETVDGAAEADLR
jgi:hypothetical protein